MVHKNLRQRNALSTCLRRRAASTFPAHIVSRRPLTCVELNAPASAHESTRRRGRAPRRSNCCSRSVESIPNISLTRATFLKSYAPRSQRPNYYSSRRRTHARSNWKTPPQQLPIQHRPRTIQFHPNPRVLLIPYIVHVNLDRLPLGSRDPCRPISTPLDLRACPSIARTGLASACFFRFELSIPNTIRAARPDAHAPTDPHPPTKNRPKPILG